MNRSMALTGIQIFKLLPKINCGDCGAPTCLAFAMNTARGSAEMDACPYLPPEFKESHRGALKQLREQYLQEMKRQELKGKKVDIERVKSHPKWLVVPGCRAVFATYFESSAGCDQEPMTVFLFVATRSNNISKISYNILHQILSGDMRKNIDLKSIYRTSIPEITCDLRKVVADLVEDILVK